MTSRAVPQTAFLMNAEVSVGSFDSYVVFFAFGLLRYARLRPMDLRSIGRKISKFGIRDKLYSGMAGKRPVEGGGMSVEVIYLPLPEQFRPTHSL